MKTVPTPMRAKLALAFLLSIALFTPCAQAEDAAAWFSLAVDESSVSYALTGPAISHHQGTYYVLNTLVEKLSTGMGRNNPTGRDYFGLSAV